MTLALRILLAAIISMMVGFYFYRSWGLEHGNGFSARDRLFGLDKKDKNTSIGFFPLVLPLALCAIFAVSVINLGWHEGLSWFFRTTVDLLLTLSLYYVALLLLMPFLRRRISARACAVAWLFPVFLYYVGYSFAMAPPHVVLYCPKQVLDLLIPVWLAGFVLVFGSSVLSHLHFRRKMLRASHPEQDDSVLEIWQQESGQLGFKTPIRLVRCALAKTPFSMGDSRRTRVTVLPECPYTEKELRLIFRHELHHIQRNDADSKLFFAFLCALLWFHPLVWLALREAGRDMELSCDEIVLEAADDDERKLYARLLLDTAGERHGFTTCLSADASSLRYRLRSVMQSRTRRSGTGILMVLLFTCLMCHGVFAVSDERTVLGKTISMESVDYCLLYEDGDELRSAENLTDESREALLSYLETLPIEHLSGTRYSAAPLQTPRLYLSARDTRQGIWLGDGSAVVYDLDHIDYNHSVIYYIRGNIDWEKIEACFHKQGFSPLFSGVISLAPGMEVIAEYPCSSGHSVCPNKGMLNYHNIAKLSSYTNRLLMNFL